MGDKDIMSKLTVNMKLEVGEIIDLTEFLQEIEWEIEMGIGNYNSLRPLFIAFCGREPIHKPMKRHNEK